MVIGDVPVRLGGPDSCQPMLRSLADRCRRTAAAGSDAYYDQVAAGNIDTLYGFGLEAFNDRLHHAPDIDREVSRHCEYLRGRCKTIGLILDVVYIEGALGFAVPSSVRRTTAWQDVLETTFSVMILQNDLVGAARDEAASDTHNAVNLLRRLHGLSRADAEHQVTHAIAARTAEFPHLERVFPDRVTDLDLPALDLERVQDVIGKLKTMSQGAPAWYTETSRYMPASRTANGADNDSLTDFLAASSRPAEARPSGRDDAGRPYGTARQSTVTARGRCTRSARPRCER
ncbi:terpene synthase family protein [Streptomyces sp. NPDC059459]|uniref:terpene synthase family protein n=1 Tax=Streptomyces sp. NPDC059459 TaxID=3346839 RepID=UPI003690B7DE